MWKLEEHGLLSRLPREPMKNLSANGKPASRLPTWNDSLAKLDEYSKYGDDWDGQGSEGPTKELSESALQLVTTLQSQGIVPPNWVVPGVSGTLSFEWLLDEGKSVEIEVTGPCTADILFYAPGGSTEYFEITNAVGAF